MFTCCVTDDDCACASADDPDLCLCVAPEGTPIGEEIAHCTKCGALVDVVDDATVDPPTKEELAGLSGRALEDALASMVETGRPLLRERYGAVGFKAELAPGEEREISIEMSNAFRPVRLSFPRPPQSRAQRLRAYVEYLPWAIGKSALSALRRCIGKDWYFPGWRAPWPGPPVEVLQIRVNLAEQLAGAIPAALFTEGLPGLSFDVGTVGPGQILTLVVRSLAREPYTLRGAWVGKAMIP